MKGSVRLCDPPGSEFRVGDGDDAPAAIATPEVLPLGSAVETLPDRGGVACGNRNAELDLVQLKAIHQGNRIGGAGS